MSKKLIKKDLLFYLIILIMVLAVFFPVSFLLYPVKWDFLDCMLPWRFIVGESIRNGDLPWWNAFQSLGYPLHADLQVSPWSVSLGNRWYWSFLVIKKVESE
jgi:hypothetical protein